MLNAWKKKVKMLRWPQQPDSMVYEWKDSVEKISPPKLMSKRSRYLVPEVDNSH